MTESSPVVSYTSQDDLCPGSSGSFLPGFKAKIIDMEGNEITAHDQRGELIVQSPSVVLGYLNNEKANAETFIHLEDGRWLKTGDEALIRPSSQGHDHLFITDRIKELIKVKVSSLNSHDKTAVSSASCCSKLTPYFSTGFPSRPRRARRSPPRTPLRLRLHRYSRSRRPRR